MRSRENIPQPLVDMCCFVWKEWPQPYYSCPSVSAWVLSSLSSHATHLWKLSQLSFSVLRGWRLEKETIIAPCRRFVWAPKQENETDNLSFHSNNTNTSVSWYSTDSRLLLEVIWPPSLHINTHPYPTLSHCFVWLMINVGGSINSSKSMAPSIDFYLLYTDINHVCHWLWPLFYHF